MTCRGDDARLIPQRGARPAPAPLLACLPLPPILAELAELAVLAGYERAALAWLLG